MGFWTMRKDECKPRSSETEESTIDLIILLIFKCSLIQEANSITLEAVLNACIGNTEDNNALKVKHQEK